MSRDPALPYASRLVAEWLISAPDQRHRRLPGTMLFADISGFTRLTERLARRGRIGAELISDTLDRTFAALLEPASEEGADLIKWGGDAVLLLLRGEAHTVRAARAAHRMRAALRDLARADEAERSGSGTLRMSIGIHRADSGTGDPGAAGFDFFLVGDPASHRELIAAGPEVSHLAKVEQACGAGMILLSAAAAAAMPEGLLGAGVAVDGSEGVGRLLRSPPRPEAAPAASAGLDAEIDGTPDVAGTLPPGIRAHLRAGAAEPEHRPVTVGFVQFSGTDALLRARGAVDATDAIHEAIVAVQRACLDHGATFFESDIAVDGGKVMLTAGAPRSAGRDGDRMLRTARAIADFRGTLSIRVGVSSGHVFAGDLGPSWRRTYSVKGDAVNLAARLLGRGGPGQVVATARVIGESSREFEAEPLAPFTVKGRRAPVHAAVVGELRSGPPKSLTPFVGRDAELAALTAAVSSASDARGTVVDVVGEPGIGKSRLVSEAVGTTSARVLAVALSTYDTETAYAAAGMLLRQVLGAGAHVLPDDLAAMLTRTVGREAPHLVPWLPLLGATLDLDLPATREVDELDERFRRGRIEQVTTEFLTAILAQPAVIIVEDAHLMDEASAALFLHLEEEAPRHPWCVIVTRREIPSGHVPLIGEDGDRRIELGGVAPEAALELLESAVDGALPSRHTLAAMTDRAAGNPLFLTSLAASVHVGDVTGDLPVTVEALLLVDIDRLPPGDRTLLRLAAVLGARFDAATLAQVHAEPVTADALAERLREFVRVSEGGELEFRHAMVRDVAYAGLPFRLRRRMHERVAVTLEASAGTAAGADLLSLHFHEAGLFDRAWSYSLRAGEEARAKYAFAQAAAFFARALEAAAQLPEPPAERSAAAVALGECLDMSGDSAGALTALRRARRDLRGDPVRTADLLHKEARITLRLGRYRAALAQLTRAMRVLDGVDGRAADAVRSRIATWYGFCLHLQHRDAQAVRWGRRAVEWAEASHDEEVLANACNALHLSYGASALHEDRPYGQLALDLYMRLGDLSGQTLTLNNLAIDAYNAGDWNEAIDAFARAAAGFHRLGDDADEATALYNQADVLVAQGRHRQALAALADALHLARRVDDEELVGLALREQARAQAGSGDRARAWVSFDRARAVLSGLDLATEVALLDAAHAEALAADGRSVEALDLVDRTITAAAGKAPDTLARLHRIRAQILVGLGLVEPAAVAAREGLLLNTGTYGGYEPALLRLALAEATADERLRTDARRVLDSLGVVG